MIFKKPSLIKILVEGLLVLICFFWMTSCGVVPKNYPKNKPFVYEYNINVEGNLSADEKNRLESGLKNQLDDSIRVRTARKFIYKGFNRPVLDKPPVYNSANADKSVVYMKSLLTSLGYFRDTISYDTTLKIVSEDQYRTTVNFNVRPGKVVRLDSVVYNIQQPELQRITIATKEDAFIKKGDPFAKATISQELDRLVDLYRNNGYLQFSREELIGLWDTLNPAILNPTLDPFEQILLLDSIKKSRENPKANLEIRLKPGFDSVKLIKYYVGDITVYPDFGIDTTGLTATNKVVDGITITSFRNLFKSKIFPPNIYFRRGDLYNQETKFKTINRFNSIGAWRLVNIEAQPRFDLDTADYTIKLTPAKKYSFTANQEISRNSSPFSGNLFGIALNLGLQNRNFARRANQSSFNIRYNIETGKDTVTDVKFVQTRQLILGYSITFPRRIPDINLIPRDARTSFAVNVGTTQRRSLYDLNTFNTSWGYEFQLKRKLFTVRLPNIEYSLLNSKPKLDTIFKYNPSLRNIFTDGFISSIIAGMTVNGGKKNYLNVLRINFEESGLLTGLIRNKFLDENLYRFIKFDIDFAQKLQFTKSALVLRLFTGIGYELNSTADPDKKNTLPFFRQYFAGGPNSMRAWGLRKLGPGSVIKDFGITGSPDRYGDMQIEANIEYRFKIANISGVDLNGALFTDIGNVWYVKKKAGSPDEVFSFNRLFTDLAVGTGFGLRIDPGFFIVRLDYSYKAKNPSPSDPAGQNKWFYGAQLFNGQFQLGISYPFIQ